MMNRRQWIALSGAALASPQGVGQAQTPSRTASVTPDKLLLFDYRPVSIYKIQETGIKKAKYPIFDVHCHGARPPQSVEEMVRLMDAVNVERTVIFTGAATPERFTEFRRPYAKYANRFDLWCNFDLSGSDQPGFGPNAMKALEGCRRLGAVGVGEISDKGRGFSSGPSTGRGGRTGAASQAGRAFQKKGSAWFAGSGPIGPHPDDPRMDPLFDRCAALGMPVNIHVSDPIWAYAPMDKTNDGLPNGYTWMIKETPGMLGHNALIESLERTVSKHPKTLFVACHLANLSYDLTRLGQIFDRYPNLYGDISARFGDLAPTPRATARFFEKYADRVLYGTDMAYTQRMFASTFRIMETLDEHFYEFDLDVCYDYHWPLHGLGLQDEVLKKIYRENARKVFEQARSGAS